MIFEDIIYQVSDIVNQFSDIMIKFIYEYWRMYKRIEKRSRYNANRPFKKNEDCSINYFRVGERFVRANSERN